MSTDHKVSKYKAALFDVDGVLITPPKLFSQQYCEKYGVDPELQQQFYATQEFKDSSVGKFDLKEAIRRHNDKWHWPGEPEELMHMWLEAENYPNDPLLKIVDQLRDAGLPVYIATQQEKYRAAFLKNKVFKGRVDGMFCSCDIGAHKHDSLFWEAVIGSLQGFNPEIKPSDIVYFDDRQSIVDVASTSGIDARLYAQLDDVKCLFEV